MTKTRIPEEKVSTEWVQRMMRDAELARNSIYLGNPILGLKILWEVKPPCQFKSGHEHQSLVKSNTYISKAKEARNLKKSQKEPTGEKSGYKMGTAHSSPLRLEFSTENNRGIHGGGHNSHNFKMG